MMLVSRMAGRLTFESQPETGMASQYSDETVLTRYIHERRMCFHTEYGTVTTFLPPPGSNKCTTESLTTILEVREPEDVEGCSGGEGLVEAGSRPAHPQLPRVASAISSKAINIAQNSTTLSLDYLTAVNEQINKEQDILRKEVAAMHVKVQELQKQAQERQEMVDFAEVEIEKILQDHIQTERRLKIQTAELEACQRRMEIRLEEWEDYRRFLENDIDTLHEIIYNLRAQYEIARLTGEEYAYERTIRFLQSQLIRPIKEDVPSFPLRQTSPSTSPRKRSPSMRGFNTPPMTPPATPLKVSTTFMEMNAYKSSKLDDSTGLDLSSFGATERCKIPPRPSTPLPFGFSGDS